MRNLRRIPGTMSLTAQSNPACLPLPSSTTNSISRTSSCTQNLTVTEHKSSGRPSLPASMASSSATTPPSPLTSRSTTSDIENSLQYLDSWHCNHRTAPLIFFCELCALSSVRHKRSRIHRAHATVSQVERHRRASTAATKSRYAPMPSRRARVSGVAVSSSA